MANADDLTFTSTPLNTLGAIPLTSYSGLLHVDYDAGTVTGNLQVAPALGIDLTNYSNFTLTPGIGQNYTITGTGQTLGLVNSTIQIEYAGNQPTSVSTQYYAAGIELASSDNSPVTSAAVCFVSGTLILTSLGETPVEELKLGDLVLTKSGEKRAIRWLGHRHVDCRKRTDSAAMLPIRISAHAFGENRPSRDLFVSPGHAICVDAVGEVLIPANALLNDTTVVQVEVDQVTYWHVELETHDVIMANGLPAESYVEMGNRRFFVNADAVAFAGQPDAVMPTHTDFCRPYLASGSIVQFVRERMRTIAVSLGWSLSHDPLGGLHVIADGSTIFPTSEDLTARFVLPAEAKDVWLVSGTNAPAHMCDSADTRALGVDVRSLAIDDGLSPRRDISMADPLLCVGFYTLEVENGPKRWTTGYARLPALLWEGCQGAFFLRVELAGPAMPHWVPPTAESPGIITAPDIKRIAA